MSEEKDKIRFEKNFKKKGKKECWEWTGTKNKYGYGNFGYKYKIIRAHRFSWMIYRGEISTGLYVCHHCDNRSCVNPQHLFLGTQQDNMQDKVKKGRSLKGKKRETFSDEWKNNMSKARKGIKRLKFSDEWRKNMSLAHIGIKFSIEHKANMSKAQKGKKHSLKSKEKMSIARKKWWGKNEQ